MASIRLFLRRSAVAFEEVWSKAKVKYEEIHRHYDANTPAKMGVAVGVAVGKVAASLYERRERQRLKEMLEKLRLEQEKMQEKLRSREEEKNNDKAGLQVLLPDSAVKDRNGMFAAVYPHGRRETIHQMNIQDHHRDAMRGLRRF